MEVTLEVAQGWCEQYESALRTSFRTESFPDEWQQQLDAEPPTSVVSAIRRYALLKHFYLLRLDKQQKRVDTEPTMDLAARQLLRREPVDVAMAGRIVQVTGRSYAALYAIARHAARLRALEDEIERIADMIADDAKRPARGRLLRLQADLYMEMSLQRQAIYAHALTESGAPAQSLDEAPSWWTEVGPADDAALLMACWESGPGRYRLLGEPPARKGKESEKEDPFGWASLFASIERQQKIPPAELYNRDLWQLLAWSRAAAPPLPEELGG